MTMAAQRTSAPFEACSPEEQLARMHRLACKALRHWGLEHAEVTLLKHRENHVYKVSDPKSATDYALRVHRSDYHSDDELRSEMLWMMALRDSGVPTAPVILPLGGKEPFVHVQTDDVPFVHQCDLLGWVRGSTIGNIESMSGQPAAEAARSYFMAGALSAAIHNQSETWHKPSGFKRKLLDADGLMGAGGFMGDYRKFHLLSARDLVEIDAARAIAVQMLTRFGTTPDRFGLTHNDFLPENLMRDGDVLNIIDFDDCGFGWHMMDMATLLFFLMGEPQYDVAFENFCAGYRSRRALPDEHVAMLPVFLFARSLSYLGWASSRPDSPLVQDLGPLLLSGALVLGRQLCAA